MILRCFILALDPYSFANAKTIYIIGKLTKIYYIRPLFDYAF